MTIRAVTRPTVLKPSLDAIPDVLKDRRQWVVWQLRWRRTRWTKIPLDPRTMRPAKSNDVRTWSSFAEAAHRVRHDNLAGIGFVFSAEDPYTGIDLDGCRCSADGVLAPWARELLAALDSYAEISPSGTGVKAIVAGRLPCTGTGRRQRVRAVAPTGAKPPEIELYHWGRFFALTGHRVPGAPRGVVERHEELTALWQWLFGRRAGRTDSRPLPSPLRGHALDRDDEELLAAARQARNGARFTELYEQGRRDAYDADHSRADLALCAMLAFWVGPDPDRIDRLFRRSALMRRKWDEKHAADGATYGELTVHRALNW